MLFDYDVLDGTEKISLALRSLYMGRGFTRYRMGKFEEYDLYSRNKDFLVSDSVITFTDTNGRLMALKPDVTLSIVKNHPDAPETLRKLCYNENVYRVSRGSGAFREIPQAGLECLGNVDEACLSEVLTLAAESLRLCSQRYVLEVSDLDILSVFVDALGAEGAVRREVLRCASEKNLHSLAALCREQGLSGEARERLEALLSLYGEAERVLPALLDFCAGTAAQERAQVLSRVLSVFAGTEAADRVQLDFSAVGDMKYYNGITFRGFLAGISESVLRGGQYDKLMRKMGRRSRAVGFAVYLDLLDRLGEGIDE